MSKSKQKNEGNNTATDFQQSNTKSKDLQKVEKDRKGAASKRKEDREKNSSKEGQNDKERKKDKKNSSEVDGKHKRIERRISKDRNKDQRRDDKFDAEVDKAKIKKDRKSKAVKLNRKREEKLESSMHEEGSASKTTAVTDKATPSGDSPRRKERHKGKKRRRMENKVVIDLTKSDSDHSNIRKKEKIRRPKHSNSVINLVSTEDSEEMSLSDLSTKKNVRKSKESRTSQTIRTTSHDNTLGESNTKTAMGSLLDKVRAKILDDRMKVTISNQRTKNLQKDLSGRTYSPAGEYFLQALLDISYVGTLIIFIEANTVNAKKATDK